MAVLGEKLSLLHYMEIAIVMASIMLMKQRRSRRYSETKYELKLDILRKIG